MSDGLRGSGPGRRDLGLHDTARRPSSQVDTMPKPRPAAYGWENRLARAITGMVIPKLQSVHRADPASPALVALDQVHRRIETHRFIGLVLSGDEREQWQFLVALRERGIELETVFMDVLAPAIRHLGLLWEDDRMSFIDVTTKSAALQRMMRTLGSQFAEAASYPNRRLLLAPVPGEQHTFGIFMLTEMFLKAGWETVVEPSASEARLCELLAAGSYDAIGLSVGGEEMLAGLGGTVARVRAASSGNDLRVFLGGRAFQDARNQLDGYGADMIETDARAAVARADDLCPRRLGA